MILVLKNADFSNNNIGKIDFQTELSEETLAILGMLTKYPAVKTNLYAQALNSLVGGLVDAGIYSKISTLVIPVMADDIHECELNVINGNRNPNPTFFDQLFALNASNRLYRTANVDYEDTNTGCHFPINHAPDNFCMFGCYNKENGDGIDMLIGGRKNAWYGYTTYLKYISTGPTGQVFQGGQAVLKAGGTPMLSPLSMVTSAFVVNFNGTDVSYKDNRIEVSGTPAATPAADALVGFDALLTGSSYSEASQGSMSIFGCGTKLTSTEVQTLYSLLENFVSKFE